MVRFAGLESARTVACTHAREKARRMKLVYRPCWRITTSRQRLEGLPFGMGTCLFQQSITGSGCSRQLRRARCSSGTGIDDSTSRIRKKSGIRGRAMLTSWTNEAVFWLLCFARDASNRRFQAGPASAEAAPAVTATAATGALGAAMR